jgi:hypothetical protein
MNPLIPLWIIGGPFVGLLILAFSFKGPSTIGSAPRSAPRGREVPDPSAPLLEPMHPDAPRRRV